MVTINDRKSKCGNLGRPFELLESLPGRSSIVFRNFFEANVGHAGHVG